MYLSPPVWEDALSLEGAVYTRSDESLSSCWMTSMVILSSGRFFVNSSRYSCAAPLVLNLVGCSCLFCGFSGDVGNVISMRYVIVWLWLIGVFGYCYKVE